MKLDSQQEVVANHREGHALVLAGAGSGKTATIVRRAARTIQDGADPARMVMMTFTNKAGREMRHRLNRQLDDLGFSGQRPTVTTFHSFGQRLISKNPESCNRKPNATLMPESDQESLLLKSLKKRLDHKTARQSLHLYEIIRNNGLVAGLKEDRHAIMIILQDQIWGRAEDALSAFADYEAEKEKSNLLDYHDLLTLPIRALQTDKLFLERVRYFTQDLTIDEAQDTNPAQYRLIKLLAPPSANHSVLMIGDYDQSIHCWRGATPENLMEFEKEYQPRVYRLESNYRSLPKIVHSANKLIRNNTSRFEKTSTPTRHAHHDPIRQETHKTGYAMARCIAKSLSHFKYQGVCPSQMAVLYRTNKMAEVLEGALLTEGLPYRIYKGMELLNRAESLMLIACMRFAINPYDRQAFERMSDLVSGLGEKKIQSLYDGLAPHETLLDGILRLPKPILEGFAPLIRSLFRLREKGPESLLEFVRTPEIIGWVRKRAQNALKADGTSRPEHYDIWWRFSCKEALSVEEKEKLTEAVGIDCKNYHEKVNYASREIGGRMRQIIQSIQDRIEEARRMLGDAITPDDLWYEAMNVVVAPPDEDGGKPRISLMTCHSAKGLEWEVVHVAGFSDGLMPLKDTQGHIEDPEEERRLAYVAITRAKNHLFLHHPESIDLVNGRGVQNLPVSRYAQEAGLLDEPKEEIQDDRQLKFA